MNVTEEEERWLWPRYNPPGLLIGPLVHKRTPSGGWVVDWDAPGARQRHSIEIDFIEDLVRRM